MKPSELRILISGGGTGGHVFPAIAIAKAIERLHPGAIIRFVGAKGRMEMEKVPLAGYQIEGLWISGLQRRLTMQNLLFPIKVLASLWKSWRIVRRFRPDAAIGVGGYASAPAVYVASRMGVPSLIQEQNAFPGIANRILSKHADLICVAYEGMEKYFPASRIRMTGNPVRRDVLDKLDHRTEASMYFGLDAAKPTILSVGGSLGAKTLNTGMHAMLQSLTNAGYQVVWQTGRAYAAETEHLRNEWKGKGVCILPFIDRMDLAYAMADLVVSRAGAIAIAELAAAGKAAILVPSPHVAEDHQRKNAEALVARDAAIMIADQDAKGQLEAAILDLAANPARIKTLQDNIQKLGNQYADETIARLAIELGQKKGSA